MMLFIDTSDYDEVKLGVINKSEIFIHKFQSRSLSEILLHQIKSFLKKQKTSLVEIKKIVVVIGPGGFSRIRSAVAVANALAFALKVPIAGINKAEVPTDLSRIASLSTKKMVEPRYGKQPNITMSK